MGVPQGEEGREGGKQGPSFVSSGSSFCKAPWFLNAFSLGISIPPGASHHLLEIVSDGNGTLSRLRWSPGKDPGVLEITHEKK